MSESERNQLISWIRKTKDLDICLLDLICVGIAELEHEQGREI